MGQQWPPNDIVETLLGMYKGNPEAGYIQHFYHVEGGCQADGPAVAKAIMELMEGKIALAVDVVNGIIFMNAAIFGYFVSQGNEAMLRQLGFRGLFDLLKNHGSVPVHTIEIKKNGSIKYLD
jgi:hypothetical protein